MKKPSPPAGFRALQKDLTELAAGSTTVTVPAALQQTLVTLLKAFAPKTTTLQQAATVTLAALNKYETDRNNYIPPCNSTPAQS